MIFQRQLQLLDQQLIDQIGCNLQQKLTNFNPLVREGFFMKTYRGIFYLIVLFIPQMLSNFGAADVIGTQWLGLSISLILSVLVASVYNKLKLRLLLKSNFFKILLFFYSWVFISIFFSLNKVESVYVFLRLIVIPLQIVIFYSFAKDLKNIAEIFSFIIAFFLSYELFLVYREYINIISYVDYSFDFAVNLKGVTGNKNIAAASIAIKIPFIIYIFNSYRNGIIRISSLLLILLSSYSLILISSRAILLALIAVIISYIFYVYYKKGFFTKYNFAALFLVIPFLISQITLNDSDATPTKRLNTITNYSDSESANIRLRYYKHGLTQITQNPIIGCGIGNWKIKSIDYDSETMKGYIVPYNLHNDFLEMATELGLIGAAAYILLFFLFFYRFLKITINKKNFELWKLTLFLSLLVYFIDANFNFPMQRVCMTTMFISIFSLIIIDELKTKHDE